MTAKVGPKPGRDKRGLSDLALFGGAPAFKEQLHVGRPNILNRDHLLERLNDLLDRRWLTNRGPYVQEFERRIADILGVGHCVAVCNGTIGLQIIIRAAGLTGEVIVPSMTFVATAHALQWLGITPVFADIDPQTHNMDPKRVEELITDRTTGIIGVHLWGRPCDVASLSALARRYNLTLIFDAAHAFACSHNARMIGGFGCTEVFSFHATKFLNALEGGVVTTNNDELAEKIRLMSDFGFSDHDRVVCIGTNGKMNEVSAAVGLTMLEDLDGLIAVNRRIYRHYQQSLAAIPGVRLMKYDDGEKCNYQYIVVEVDENVTHATRDQLMEILWAENILARRYFYPGCHRMEPYCSCNPQGAVMLPETEKLLNRVLCLPTGTAVSPEDVSRICRIIGMVVAHGPDVRARIPKERK